MCKSENFNYALFGNPVNHSHSPIIHDAFSKQTGIFHVYKAINIPLNQFYSIVSTFLKIKLKALT